MLEPSSAAEAPAGRRWFLLGEIPMWIVVGAMALADEVLLVKTLAEFWANQIAGLLP